MMSGRSGGVRGAAPGSNTQPPAPSTFSRGGRGERTVGRGYNGRYVGAPVQESPQLGVHVSEESQSVAAESSAPVAAEIEGAMEKLALRNQSVATPTPKVKFIPRPGFGTKGKPCCVKSNHFLVEISDRNLHQYDVTITPEILSRGFSRAVVSRLDLFRVSHLGGRSFAYDGSKSLYTAGPLPFESKEFVVQFTDRDARSRPSGASRREQEFKVTLKLASRPDLHQLQRYLSGRQKDIPQETVQALDVVLRAKASELNVVVGRSFFSPNLGKPGLLGEGLEYWRGYYQSIRPTQMGLSFNIDISARPFYEPVLVTEFVAKYLKLRDLETPLSSQQCTKLKKVLKGIRIKLTHRGTIRKISSVSAQPLRQLSFLSDDNSRMTVVHYYQSKYNITLRYASLPALQTGSDTNPVYFPMELCEIVAGHRYQRKLNERQVTELLNATCQRPLEREKGILQTMRNINFKSSKLITEEFGIRVKEEPALINARVLPPPLLKYDPRGREPTVSPSRGQWNMIDKKMVLGGKVDSWTCVSFSSLHPNSVFQFCRELIDICNLQGMSFNPQPVMPIQRADPRQVEATLRNIARAVPQNRKLHLLIVILAEVNESYGKIKRICETEYGFVSQCCRPKIVREIKKRTLANVSLKINLKAGGKNAVLDDAVNKRIHLVTDIPTIIFGADVTHPAPGDDTFPSIAAVVASMDWPEVTKYKGLVSAQPHREEIIRELYTTRQDPQRGLVHEGMVRELLISFRRATNQKPQRIIFYRDGVSEGQFSQVLLHEMDALRKACASLEEGYLPPVTFIVVQKRHHTRFFPADYRNQDMTDKSGNILPGTVVDKGICHPTEFDFYLTSHAGIRGTSRPAHYHVLYDENRFSADAMQTLTNNLCYTFQRCTRSVSVVPPAYYAHLAASRARHYVEDEFSDSGSSGMPQEVKPLPQIRGDVKEVMFFI